MFMIAVVFGDEKNANPIPKIISVYVMWFMGVVGFIGVKLSMPKVIVSIPIEAIIDGLCLSASNPATGESVA